MKRVSCVFVFVASFSILHAASYFVSSTAVNGGNGSFLNPWKLQTALNHPAALLPGDTVWMRGGTYSATEMVDASLGAISFICKTNGTAAAPIIFRNYNNERATIDGLNNQIALFVGNCSYTWFWGLEVMSSATVRTPNRAFIYCTAPNMKFINMDLHDMADGIDLWNAAKSAELYGCLIYHNGWDEATGGHGHGIYTQNDTTNTRLIHNNIFFSSYGYNVKLWSTNQGIDNYDLQNNIVFNGGSCSQATESRMHNFFIVNNNPSRLTKNLVMKHNYTYAGTTISVKGLCNNIGANYGSINMTLDSNYFLGQLRLTAPFYGFSAIGNKVYGGTALQYISAFGTIDWSLWQDTESSQDVPATGLEYFVLPNKYEPGRANIAIYNWSEAPSVSINVSTAGLVAGDKYELVHAMDYYHDIIPGTYPADGNITVPMTGHSFAQAIGGALAPVSQFPKFGAFVLRKVADSGNTGISELASENILSIFPNPALDAISLNLSIANPGNYQISIHNAMGQRVMLQDNLKFEHGSQSIQIDTRNLPRGVYVLHLQGNGSRVSQEFLLH